MAAKLPIFHDSEDMSNMNTTWASAINPFLGNPYLQGYILKNITLQTGVNVINHLLSRTQRGWTIADVNQPVTIYRSQPFNDITLTLTASGACVVNIYVF